MTIRSFPQLMFIVFCLLLIQPSLHAQDRGKDPLVVSGAQVPGLLGSLPADLVGFAYESGSWQQVPIQIDERVVKDVNAPYGGQGCLSPSAGPQPWDVVFYADPSTAVGPDTNPDFDADDELVFMQFDIGDKFDSGACPAGVLGSTLFELEVIDPIGNSLEGYLYLFEQDGSLQQSAGENYVTYDFILDSGQPISAYPICENETKCPGGPNNGQCEDSKLSTDEYEVEYSARWIEDVLRIKSGNSTGIDILDRHQGFIAPSFCGRTEDTFSAARGPIVNAIDGPVRAIRSVMGSNSGTFNQLTARFTKYRVDYTLDFRVHDFARLLCSGFADVFDFSTAATGMTYYNDKYPNGVAIDGSPDNLTNTAVTDWDLVSGPHGSIAAAFTFATDMTLLTSAQVCQGNDTGAGAVESYYDDRGNNSIDTCTGNKIAFGAFGFRLFTDACTDRRYNSSCSNNNNFFVENRFHYYLPPNATPSQAQTYGSYAKNPLQVNGTSLAGNCGSGSGLSASVASTPVSCAGGSDGSATATVSGGSGNYAYLWSNNQTQASIQNLTAGTYSVTVTDNVSLNTATASATVSEPSALALTISSTDETNGGGNGTASVQASGGTSPYSYAWTGPAGFSSNAQNIQGLSAGVYNVLVTDASGCTISGSATIVNQTGGCTFTQVDFEDFESGFGIWNDGGANCVRLQTGTSSGFAVRIRNGNNSSLTFTDVLDLSAYQELRVSFDFSSRSMESGESFSLELSTNGGGAYSSLKTWVSGTDFSPNDDLSDVVNYSGALGSNCRLRFVNDGNQNNDRIFLDAIEIEGCANTSSRYFGQQLPLNEQALPGLDQWQLAPNPTSGELRLSFHAQSHSTAHQVQILDSHGRLLQQRALAVSAGWNKEVFQLSDLAPGLYWLQLRGADGHVKTLRFVKSSGW
ncbi:MAG: T9SS type A sorting domain-containing protein [Bacteroidota bacterium]